MSAENIQQAMLEYGRATRGDWSDFDGRSLLGAMELFVGALRGELGADWSLAHWRRDIGVCPAGLGHWDGKWGHCEESCGEHDWEAP